MYRVDIDAACCKGCGICLAICNKRVFTRGKKRNGYGTAMPEAAGAGQCIACRLCERMCPDGAINVEEAAESETEKENDG